MKVEIISVGTKLLMSDTLDINTPYISRSLREASVQVTCKVTVGDESEMIADVLRDAFKRADVVLMVGSADDELDAMSRRIAAQITGRELLADGISISGATLLGKPGGRHSGLIVEEGNKALVWLPGNRREMTYLLDNDVLPYIQARLSPKKRVERILLRTVDIMESTLKQQLADLSLTSKHQISYDSFAGQTTIQLWAALEPSEEAKAELEELRQAIRDRLGDHIFGEGDARFEEVVLSILRGSGRRVAIGECHTGEALTKALSDVPGCQEVIAPPSLTSCEQLVADLNLEQPTPDQNLTDWCQIAAEKLLAKARADLALVVFNRLTQGGAHILVTLASPNGVSVTQRSFGGHPGNINQWSYTLGLAHLRRWLLAHQ